MKTAQHRPRPYCTATALQLHGDHTAIARRLHRNCTATAPRTSPPRLRSLRSRSRGASRGR